MGRRSTGGPVARLRTEDWPLFVRMLREEWRLHASLFGRRFGTYPIAVAILSGLGVWLLGQAETSTSAITGGLHWLIAFLGLQVGTIGLVGRDALRDVLGETTLLVFSARTLPITWRRLLAIFLLKDLAYYSALFLAPIAAGYGVVAVASGTPPAQVGRLWVTTTGMFGLGVGASLTLIGLGTRTKRLAGTKMKGKVLFTGVIATVAVAASVAVLTSPIDPVALTPLGAFRTPTPTAFTLGFAPAVALVVVGPLLFEPVDDGVTRTGRRLYPRIRALVGRERAVTVRTLLEVLRSGGSVWKVLFSMGILFGATALLVEKVTAATRLDPAPGIAFGTLLGLGAFTTYNWVTQLDDAAAYRRYPLSMRAVFGGKRTAYLLLTLPAGYVYLALSALWVPARALAVGAVVFPLVAVYVFGVTAAVAGLSPNELLFDTPRFAVFGVALTVVAVPLVTAALVASTAPTLVAVASVAFAAVTAGVGLALARWAGPRWERGGRER